MIDTHSHLLPGLDHGCPDLETSVLMAREAARSGVKTVICTPHLPEMDRAFIERAREAVVEVRSALGAAGIELTLLLGFEVDMAVGAASDPAALETLAIEGAPGVVILEMPYRGWPSFMEECLFRMATAGLRPILAHPERNERVQRSPELLTGCLKAGAVAQATAASLVGGFGRTTERTFFRLLAEGLISLLASDAHHFLRELWTLIPILESLKRVVRDEDLMTLVEENPRRLLAGEPLLAVRSVPPDRAWPRKAWARGDE